MRFLTEQIEPPEHEYGYTALQLERILGDDLPNFWRWMNGQTMMLDPELGTIVYAPDLRRYLEGMPIID